MLVNIIVLFNDSKEGEKEFVTNNFSQYFKECTERRLLYKSVNKLIKFHYWCIGNAAYMRVNSE